MFFKAKTEKKKVSKRLKKYLKRRGYYDVLEALEKRNDMKNYFDFSEDADTKISYLSDKKLPEKSHLLFDKEYRKNNGYHAKIGKIISDKVTAQCIASLTSQLMNRKGAITKKLQFTNEICKYYDEEIYCAGNGELNHSCMRHWECRDYIRFYEYCDNVQLVILLNDNGELMARALNWKAKDSEGNDVIYLDRVYAINDNLKNIIYDWGKKQGYLTYKDNERLYININIDEDQPMPYLDSFCFYSTKGVLSTHSGVNPYEIDCVFQHTEGLTIYDIATPRCSNCGESMTRGEECYSDTSECSCCQDCATWSNYHNTYVLDNRVVNINGVIYDEDCDALIEDKISGDLIEIDDSCTCVITGVVAHIDYFVYSKDAEGYILKEDAICINDEYYHKDSDSIMFDKETQGYYTLDDYDLLIEERKKSEAINV